MNNNQLDNSMSYVDNLKMNDDYSTDDKSYIPPPDYLPDQGLTLSDNNAFFIANTINSSVDYTSTNQNEYYHYYSELPNQQQKAQPHDTKIEQQINLVRQIQGPTSVPATESSGYQAFNFAPEQLDISNALGPVSVPAMNSNGDDYFNYSVPSTTSSSSTAATTTDTNMNIFDNFINNNINSTNHYNSNNTTSFIPVLPHDQETGPMKRKLSVQQLHKLNKAKPYTNKHLSTVLPARPAKPIRQNSGPLQKSNLSSTYTREISTSKTPESSTSSPFKPPSSASSISSASHVPATLAYQKQKPKSKKPQFHLPLDNIKNQTAMFQQLQSLMHTNSQDSSYNNLQIMDPDMGLNFEDNDVEFNALQENITPLMKPPGSNTNEYFENNVHQDNSQSLFHTTSNPLSHFQTSNNPQSHFHTSSDPHSHFHTPNQPQSHLHTPNNSQSHFHGDNNPVKYFSDYENPRHDSHLKDNHPNDVNYDDFTIDCYPSEDQYNDNEYHYHQNDELYSKDFHPDLSGFNFDVNLKADRGSLSNSSNQSGASNNGPVDEHNNNHLRPSVPPTLTGHKFELEVMRPGVQRTDSSQSINSISSIGSGSGAPNSIKKDTSNNNKKHYLKGAVCTVCDKYISRDLKRHMRTHNEIGRFQCVFPRSMCKHKTGYFNRPYDYKKHLLHLHFEFDDPKGKGAHTLTDKLPLTGACIACRGRFVAGDWLDNHILTNDSAKRCCFVDSRGPIPQPEQSDLSED